MEPKWSLKTVSQGIDQNAEESDMSSVVWSKPCFQIAVMVSGSICFEPKSQRNGKEPGSKKHVKRRMKNPN
jgi:hypothetical protein